MRCIEITPLNYTEVLRVYLKDKPGTDSAVTAKMLASADYHQLSIKERISVMALLCNLCLECTTCHDDIDEAVKELDTVKKELWNVKSERAKQAKEREAQCKAEEAERQVQLQKEKEQQQKNMFKAMLTADKSSKQSTSKVSDERQSTRLDQDEAAAKKQVREDTKMVAQMAQLRQDIRWDNLGSDRSSNKYLVYSTGRKATSSAVIVQPAEADAAEWQFYGDWEQWQALTSQLNPSGRREHSLIKATAQYHGCTGTTLEANLSGKKPAFELGEEPCEASNACDLDPQMLARCQKELVDTESSLMEDWDAEENTRPDKQQRAEWAKQVKEAASAEDLKECILKLEETLNRQAFENWWARYQAEWKQMVKDSATLGSLSLLALLLASSVKSSSDQRCSVCRNTDQPESMLLCDQCDCGFHTSCIKLRKVPKGDWFCPHCIAQAEEAREEAEEAEFQSSKRKAEDENDRESSEKRARRASD